MVPFVPKRPGEISLAGSITLPEWSVLLPTLEGRLRERPDRPLVIDCGRVTRFSPGAFFALARLIEAAPGRVLLRNWPASVGQVVGSQLLVLRALDGILAAVTAAAGSREQREPGADDSVARLSAAVSDLKRVWGGVPECPAV